MNRTSRILIPAVALSFAVGISPLAAQGQGPAQPAPGQSRPAPSQPQEPQREQPRPEQREQQQAVRTAEGELLRVNTEEKMFTVRAAANQEQQFKYTDDTEVTGEGRNIEGLATMTGTRVKVEYKTEGSAMVATKIDIQPRAEQSKPAPAPSPAPGAARP